jgi:hypothetical protein
MLVIGHCLILVSLPLLVYFIITYFLQKDIIKQLKEDLEFERGLRHQREESNHQAVMERIDELLEKEEELDNIKFPTIPSSLCGENLNDMVFGPIKREND